MNKVVRAGLGFALAGGLTACASEVAGNGFVGNRDKCVPYEAEVTLKPDMSISLAVDDISASDVGFKDKLELTNRAGSLLIQRSSYEDDTELQVSSEYQTISDDDGEIRLAPTAEGQPYKIRYSEEDSSVVMALEEGNGDTLILHLQQSCE